MRLSVNVHPVVRHAPLQRVLVPTTRLRHLWVRGPDPITSVSTLTGSRADLLRLGALVRLAATSPHSALFVPARDNEPGDELGHGWWRTDSPLVDLLVVRGDVGLRPSGWPEVRRVVRRSTGRPGTVRTPAAREEGVWRKWDWTGLNRIKLTDHAATLVLSSTARSLLRLGDMFTQAGELLASNEEIHQHGHAHLSGMPNVFTDQSIWFVVYGLDPIFHKSRWAKPREEQAD